MGHFKQELCHGWRSLTVATIGMAAGIPVYMPVSSLVLPRFGNRVRRSPSAR